jgi:Na+-transporting methylmalonyl-CoA/oxaloacetate decarboxylase gamma subunit
MMRLVLGVTVVLFLLVLLIPVVAVAGALLGFMVAAGLA